MTQMKYCQGTISTLGSPVLLARVVDYYSQILTSAQITAISYSVFLLEDHGGSLKKTALTGYSNNALNVSEVFFETLQKDETWTSDTQGYNFRHLLDNTNSALFSQSLRHYQVEYTLELADGSPPIGILFRLFTL